jgi:AraC family transcriptional regulator
MRIMALHEGEWKPLFNSLIEGEFSPSPSMRVEKHRIEPGFWPSVLLPKQIVTLALNTHEVQYESEPGNRETAVHREGSVTIERRKHEQSIYWRSPATTLIVELDDTVLDEVQEADADFGAEECQVQRLSPLLYALEAERQQGYPHGRIFVDGIEQAIACVVAMFTAKDRVKKSGYVPAMAPHQMRRVNDYVKAHLDKKIILRDMARQAGLSPSHFSRLFRRSAGTTPHQYVLERRIDHAKSLMTDSRHSLLDIAIATGFRTHQHFSKVFQRITGHSPRQYRSQL